MSLLLAFILVFSLRVDDVEPFEALGSWRDVDFELVYINFSFDEIEG